MVGVVLLEAADAGGAAERAAGLITVEYTKLGHADGSSRYERSRLAKMRQWLGQFIGLRVNCFFSTSSTSMLSE